MTTRGVGEVVVMGQRATETPPTGTENGGMQGIRSFIGFHDPRHHHRFVLNMEIETLQSY